MFTIKSYLWQAESNDIQGTDTEIEIKKRKKKKRGSNGQVQVSSRQIKK